MIIQAAVLRNLYIYEAPQTVSDAISLDYCRVKCLPTLGIPGKIWD